MRRRVVAVIAALCLAFVACSNDEPKSQPTPSGTSPEPTSPPATSPPAAAFALGKVKIRLKAITSGLAQPVFLTHAGDGTGLLYVVEQPGRIKIIDRAGDAKGTFLDISGRVMAGGEQGLLGLAFHPEYESNGRFFAYYTNEDGDNVVVEFKRSTGTKADPGSERRLLLLRHPQFSNHDGGWIGFGPDGFLYIGTGDGGGGGDPFENGQSLGSLLGKLLRIDVDGGSPYGIPPDNPFVDKAGARKEIWAYGLRNPWRESFDRATGDLWIADVGQGSREEVNVQKSSSDGGGNYGWSIMEGTTCYSASSCNREGLILPVTEYFTSDGCAVTGGYVYRGAAFPDLVGGYFFADYCNGMIFGLDARKALAGPVSERRLLDTGLNVSSFGEDEAGELYVIGLGGTVHRIVSDA